MSPPPPCALVAHAGHPGLAGPQGARLLQLRCVQTTSLVQPTERMTHAGHNTPRQPGLEA
jgi:hypothetical protein